MNGAQYDNLCISFLLFKGNPLDNDDNNNNINFMEDDLSRRHSPYPDPRNSGRLVASPVHHGNEVVLAKVSKG